MYISKIIFICIGRNFWNKKKKINQASVQLVWNFAGLLCEPKPHFFLTNKSNIIKEIWCHHAQYGDIIPQ